MRLRTQTLIALLVLTALPVTMSASQGTPLPAGPAARSIGPSHWDADRKNPYSRLFKPHAPSAATPAPPSTGKPEIKCGMMLIPIDPNIDPRMVVPPQPSSSKFTIRAVDPPICR